MNVSRPVAIQEVVPMKRHTFLTIARRTDATRYRYGYILYIVEYRSGTDNLERKMFWGRYCIIPCSGRVLCVEFTVFNNVPNPYLRIQIYRFSLRYINMTPARLLPVEKDDVWECMLTEREEGVIRLQPPPHHLDFTTLHCTLCLTVLYASLPWNVVWNCALFGRFVLLGALCVRMRCDVAVAFSVVATWPLGSCCASPLSSMFVFTSMYNANPRPTLLIVYCSRVNKHQWTLYTNWILAVSGQNRGGKGTA